MSVQYPNRARMLRDRLLGQQVPPLRSIEIDGETYHLRAPLLEDRDEISRMALGPKFDPTKPETMNVAIDRMMAAALIKLACDEKGNPIFEAADFDSIRQTFLGSSLEVLGRKAVEALNPTGEASGGTRESASTTSSPTA